MKRGQTFLEIIAFTSALLCCGLARELCLMRVPILE